MRIGNSLKEFILLNYNQEELFAKYMGISISDISSSILDRAYKINNPLRIDKDPSLGFYYDKSNKLKCWDYAVPLYRFDIFDLVAYLLGVEVNTPNGFVKVCTSIIEGTSFNATKKEITKSTTTSRYKTIIPMYRDWYPSDISLWEQWGISNKHCINRYTSPITHAFVDNKAVYTSYANKNKYAYFIGSYKKVALYKLYGIGEDIRFITNNKFKIEAPHELYTADTLIITKARKDKLAIECNIEGGYIEKYLEQGIPLVNTKYCITNLSGETVKLPKTFINTLRKNYKRILLNVDYDLAGIMSGIYFKYVYDIEPVFIGNKFNEDIFTDANINAILKYVEPHTDKVIKVDDVIDFAYLHSGDHNSKDISDYIKDNGKDKGKQLIERLF